MLWGLRIRLMSNGVFFVLIGHSNAGFLKKFKILDTQILKKKKYTLNKTHNVNNRDEVTTDTEDKAIAPDAIQGFREKFKGRKTPAAIGIPIKLYIRAKIKFDLIFRTVFLDRSMAATTSIKLFYEIKIYS